MFDGFIESKFPCTAELTEALSQRMRRKPGQNLPRVCVSGRDVIELDDTAMADLAVRLQRGQPVPASTFTQVDERVLANSNDQMEDPTRNAGRGVVSEYGSLTQTGGR